VEGIITINNNNELDAPNELLIPENDGVFPTGSG
jgi:hypothetical protein